MEINSLWASVLGLVSESGVWAMLFVALLIILIKNNNNREAKYQQIINKLSSSLKVVEEIKEDVEDLKFSAGIGGIKKQSAALPQSISQKDLTKEDTNDAKTKNENL